MQYLLLIYENEANRGNVDRANMMEEYGTSSAVMCSGDRHHCLSAGRRHARNRAGRGGARKPARHEALQPHRRRDHADEVERDPD